jgi:hypothetical protein
MVSCIIIVAQGDLPWVFQKLGTECYGFARHNLGDEKEETSQHRNDGWDINDRYIAAACCYAIAIIICAYYAVKSFVELVPLIFKLGGVKFFLSEHLCQDPLENFFGCQRQRGRVNENPTVEQFCSNTQALRVIGSLCRDSVKGNCRGNKKYKQALVISEKENEPLQKRKRKHK